MPSWQVTPESQFIWHSWNNEHLLYNNASGSTHLLGEAEAVLLQSLQKAPQTIPQLEKGLSELFEAVPSEEATKWLQNTLFQFKSLGLATIEN